MKENEARAEPIEEQQMPPTVERTMRQMLQQMDVLTSTVSFLCHSYFLARIYRSHFLSNA